MLTIINLSLSPTLVCEFYYHKCHQAFSSPGAQMVPYSETHSILQFSKWTIRSLKSSRKLNSDLPPVICLEYPVSWLILWVVCKKHSAYNQAFIHLWIFLILEERPDRENCFLWLQDNNPLRLRRSEPISFLVGAVHTRIVYLSTLKNLISQGIRIIQKLVNNEILECRMTLFYRTTLSDTINIIRQFWNLSLLEGTTLKSFKENYF